MKKPRFLAFLFTVCLLFSNCFGIFGISAESLNEGTANAKDASDYLSKIKEPESGFENDKPSKQDTLPASADMPDSEMLAEYEADGSLEERQNFMQTLDELNKPFYSTFTVNADQKLNVKDIANIVSTSNPSNMPTSGEAKALVFLVDFPDMPHDKENTRETAENAFFGEDSLSSFYLESSYSKLKISGDVIDWYTAEHERDYYVKNGISTLYREVLDAFDDQIDYSKYDADGSSYIDGLYLHFAGDNSGWGSTFWSYVTNLLFEKEYDGIKIGPRACLLHELNVETIRHETGHLLGLPDYYSYTIKSCFGNYSWVGSEDAMVGGRGDHNAVSKMILGWIDSVKLITENGDYTLDDFIKTGDAAILYPFGRRDGDSFIVIEKQNDFISGMPKIKVFRVNALTSKSSDGKASSYVHSNMYGDIPFITLITDLHNGQSATPYSKTASTHYYNEKTAAETFSGISISVPENGLSSGQPGSFSVLFELGPSIIDPPDIIATATVNQVTATIDFSVPFSINKNIEAYIVDRDGTKIATMDTKGIFSDDGYFLDQATCVVRVASYREWGFDGKNQITVGSDQDFLLKPGEEYTIVIPKGAFKTVMGDIDEMCIAVTADSTADQDEKYQTVTTFGKCSEFITLSDGRAAYAYVDTNNSENPLILALVNEDGTKQEYTVVESGMKSHVEICQLSDGSIVIGCKNKDETALAYKFDLISNTVIADIVLDDGPLPYEYKLYAFDGGFYASRIGNTDSITKIDNSMQNSTCIFPLLNFPDIARFVVGENILLISSITETTAKDQQVQTEKWRCRLYNSDWEVVAENTIFDLANIHFMGADATDNGQIVLSYYDYEDSQNPIKILVFDANLKLKKIITPDITLQKADETFAWGTIFKQIADGYFLSYGYIRQYDPKGLVEMFNTETYQQGLLFDDSFNVKSSFDVAYAASAAAVGKSGNRFIVGDEYGYYTVNAELTTTQPEITLSSDKYLINNEQQTITGVPTGATAEDVLKFIQSSAEDCRFEFRYTHAKRSTGVKMDDILSCNYELLVYDPTGTTATIYTFPQLPADYDSTFKVESGGILYNYTATEEKLVIPDFVKTVYLGSSGSNNDLSCVISLTTSAEIEGSGLPNLTELNLLEGCTEIGRSAFSYCHKLKKVVIPNTVTKLSNNAFDCCSNLEEVVIPASVTRIGGYVLANCKNLKKITYLGTKEQWDKIDFRYFDYDTDGERSGFYDLEEIYGDRIVFAGSGVIEQTVPELAISGVVLNSENGEIGFKVKKSLFEESGYVQPSLQVIFNSEMAYISEYTVDGDFYIFNFGSIGSGYNGKKALATLMGYYDGTLCLSDAFEYEIGTVPVTSITLDTSSAVLKTGGEALTLTAIINPDDSANKTVKWTTSNRKVATVKDGVVTPCGIGTAVITATTADGGFTAACEITVECSHGIAHEVEAEKSTCIKHGHDAYIVCDECGEIIEGSDAELPLAGHTGGTATCTERAVCSVCRSEYGELAAHDYITKYNSSSHWLECSVCKNTTEPEPHVYDDWEITQEAWIGSKGHRVRSCGCGHTEEGVITEDFLIGDLDGNGTADETDAVMLARYLVGWKITLSNPSATDIDRDGRITDNDSVIFERWLAGWFN